MTRMGTVGRILLAALIGVVTILGLALPGQADEAKTPINASLLLSIVSSAPVDRRETAFDQSLKESGRPPLPPAGVVQHFRQYFGPTVTAFARLDAQGQVAYAADLEKLWTENNEATGDRTLVRGEYMEVLATRA